MKKRILIYALVALWALSLTAQNSAPSCHLTPNDDATGDIIMKTVRSTITTNATYYCTMQWNAGMEGGAYCGFQDSPDKGHVFIYSIWDPSNGQTITANYIGSGTTVENFGGEGTGLKSMNNSIGWSLNEWNTLVSRRWDVGSHTYFGFWIHDISANKWHHMVTMDYPVSGVYFQGKTNAFLEDWLSTGSNKRRFEIKDGFKRKTDGTWLAMTQATFNRNDEARSANYTNKVDAGVSGGAYYMQSGGNTTPSYSGNPPITLNRNPGLAPGNSPIAFLITSTTNSSVSWSVPTSSTPQFKYTVKVNGTELVSGIATETYSASISAGNGSTVEVILEDILGRTTTKSATVSNTNPINYCPSKGNNSSYEWISSVQIGNFSNASSAAGYTDFTSQVIALTPGSSPNVSLTSGFSGTTYSEYWKIWIDFNSDGDFIDAGEQLFSTSGSSAVAGSISIPFSATGDTRMRIAMKYAASPTSCELFDYGEVEDYAVSFGGSTPQTPTLTVIYTDSNESGHEGAKAVDGNSSTIWHTKWSGGSDTYPHEIQLDLGGEFSIDGFTYLPRQDGGQNGTIAQYEIYISSTLSNWGSAVKTGTWASNTSQKTTTFTAKTGRYVRLKALSEINGNAWASAAEINVIVSGSKALLPAANNEYYIKNVDFNIYPNPASGQFIISYELDEKSFIDISLYDLSGRCVSKLNKAVQPAGKHDDIFKIEQDLGGIYLLKLIVENRIYQKKIVIVD